MQILDTPTLLVTDVLLNATCGLMCLVWLFRRGEGEFAFWGGGFITAALASIVSALTTVFPFCEILQFFVTGAAIALYWAGYRYFDGLKPFSRNMILLTLAPGAVTLLLSWSLDDALLPQVFGFATFIIVIAALVLYILRGGENQPIERKVGGWAMSAFTLALLISICLQFDSPDTQMGGFVVLLADHVVTIAFALSMFALSIDRAYRTIEEMALRDVLTATLNRGGLLAFVSNQRAGGAVLVADLDHFKSVNDTYGHAAGDAVLRDFAGRAMEVVGKGGTVSRTGGEEFVIVLPGYDEPKATAVANGMRSALGRTPVRWEDHEIAVTVSVGLTLWHPNEDFSQAVGRADAALYRAKAGGRNRIAA